MEHLIYVCRAGSCSANLMEVKTSKAQGRHREVGSEGSVEHRCEPMRAGCNLVLTGCTSGLVHETRKGFQVVGTLHGPLGRLGRGWDALLHPREHHEQQEQCDKQNLVAK